MSLEDIESEVSRSRWGQVLVDLNKLEEAIKEDFDSAGITPDADGSVIEILKQALLDIGAVQTTADSIEIKVDALTDYQIRPTDNSTDYVNATGGEQDIVAYTPSTEEKINLVKLDMTALTQSGTYKVYIANEEVISDTWTHGADNLNLFITLDMILNEEMKVSWEPSTAEGADRNIPWSVRVER